MAAPQWMQAPATGASPQWMQAPAVGATPVQPGEQADSLVEAIVAGVQSSATGLALRGKLPSQVLGEDAPWYHRLGAGVGGVVADFPLSIAGAIGGASAGTAVAPGVGSAIGGAAGAFAAPMALRDALMAAYSGNHAASWSGAWDIAWSAIKGGVKGAAIGAATAGAGRLAAPLIAPASGAVASATGSALAGKVAMATGQAGVELATLTTTAAALEGHLPTARDFMDNAILLAGMKGAAAAARGLRNTFADTGRRPEQVLADAMKDPELRAALEKGEVPRAYEPIAAEERLKAAYNEPRPEFFRQAVEALDKWQALDPNKMPDNPVVWDRVVDTATAKGLLRILTDGFNAEYAKKTRGVVPNLQSALDGLKMLVGGALPEHAAGWAANSGEIAARVYLLRGAANFATSELAKYNAVPAAERSLPMKLRVVAAVDRVAMLHGEFLGVRAEAGRSLQIFSAIKRDPSFLGEAEALIAAIEKSKGNVDTIAALAAGFKTPAEMIRFAESLQKATGLEMVIAAWKASIISGIMTHIANPLGSVTKWLAEVPESTIAATLTAAERKINGDPLTWAQYQARALAPIHGMQLGALDGLKLAGEILRGKESAFDKADQYRGARIPGPVGKVTRTIFATLQAEDALFRVPAERAQAYILAVDRLAKDGIHPSTPEGRSLIAQYIARPELGLSQTAGEKALASIRQAGHEAVFSQQQGPHIEMAMRAVSGTPMEFILPFRNTPMNLLSWAVQHTPGLNFLSARWRADWAAGGERQARAVSRIIVGAGLTATAFSLAQNGLMTGGMLYLTPEQRAARIAAGDMPYSITIGDKKYSYQRIEPVAKVLGIATDLVELAIKTKNEEDNAKIAMQLVLLFGNATISTTYMSGLSNAIQGVTDPVRFGENFLEQYAMSLVPKAIGQAAVIMDPHKREIDGVVDAIQSQLPIFRERLLPKRDAWGVPQKNDRWFEVMPIATSDISKDKVRTEAARLSIAIAAPPKFLIERGPFNQTDKRVNLEPEQRDIIKEVSGKTAMSILAPIVNAPDWERLPEFVKANIYNEVIQKTRAYGVQQAAPADTPARSKKRQDIIDRVNREWQAVQGK